MCSVASTCTLLHNAASNVEWKAGTYVTSSTQRQGPGNIYIFFFLFFFEWWDWGRGFSTTDELWPAVSVERWEEGKWLVQETKCPPRRPLLDGAARRSRCFLSCANRIIHQESPPPIPNPPAAPASSRGEPSASVCLKNEEEEGEAPPLCL